MPKMRSILSLFLFLSPTTTILAAIDGANGGGNSSSAIDNIIADGDTTGRLLLAPQRVQPSSLPAVPLQNLTLYYFKFRGRGEPIRLLLHFAGIKFNDHRISSDQWLGGPAREGFKNKTPFGHIPLIRLVDGREMAESFAIMRLIGRQNGLAGDDPWESAKIDEFADFHKDAFSAFHDALSLTEEQIEEESAESLAKFHHLLDQFMPIYQRQFRSSGGSGFLFKRLTWPDFLVADFVESIKAVRPSALTDWPEMVELHRKVHGLPQLEAYLSARKFTRF